MKTVLLTVAYDGTEFHGWQKQPNLRTVQGVLEDALGKICAQSVAVTASGRTDEGVHAAGQTVSFDYDASVPVGNLPAALGSVLPPDLRALSAREVENGFNARKSAKRKRYVYRMYCGTEIPQHSRYALHLPRPLDLPLLEKACAHIAGTHDFVRFYCAGSSAKTTVRTVYDCSLQRNAEQGNDALYEFSICGNGFLYKMVRLLVGALLSLSDGKITLDEFVAALDGKAGIRKIPAPPHGLTLQSVEYE